MDGGVAPGILVVGLGLLVGGGLGWMAWVAYQVHRDHRDIIRPERDRLRREQKGGR